MVCVALSEKIPTNCLVSVWLCFVQRECSFVSIWVLVSFLHFLSLHFVHENQYTSFVISDVTCDLFFIAVQGYLFLYDNVKKV